MDITNRAFIKAFEQAAEVLASHEDELCALDSQLGDGDHGAAIHSMSLLIRSICIESLQEDEPQLEVFLESISDKMLGSGNGSTSSLWGSYFYGLSEGASGASCIDGSVLKKMLQCGLASLASISNAKVGDKTMMDAVIPATEAALLESDENIVILLDMAAKAAQTGAERTKEFVARFGRAKNFKEKALGYKDAGATSYSYFISALADNIKK